VELLFQPAGVRPIPPPETRPSRSAAAAAAAAGSPLSGGCCCAWLLVTSHAAGRVRARPSIEARERTRARRSVSYCSLAGSCRQPRWSLGRTLTHQPAVPGPGGRAERSRAARSHAPLAIETAPHARIGHGRQHTTCCRRGPGPGANTQGDKCWGSSRYLLPGRCGNQPARIKGAPTQFHSARARRTKRAVIQAVCGHDPPAAGGVSHDPCLDTARGTQRSGNGLPTAAPSPTWGLQPQHNASLWQPVASWFRASSNRQLGRSIASAWRSRSNERPSSREKELGVRPRCQPAPLANPAAARCARPTSERHRRWDAPRPRLPPYCGQQTGPRSRVHLGMSQGGQQGCGRVKSAGSTGPRLDDHQPLIKRIARRFTTPARRNEVRVSLPQPLGAQPGTLQEGLEPLSDS